MRFKTLYTYLFFSFLLAPSFVLGATEITGEANGRNSGVMTMDINPPSAVVTIEDINTADNCDNLRQICYIEGFSWSDTIGWTAWDGTALEADIITNGGSFPDEYFAKVTYRGAMDGYIWNEHTGWTQLSTCAGETTSLDCNANSYCSWTGTACEIDATADLPEVSSQDADDFGVYIDFCPLNEDQVSCDSDSHCLWDGAESSCSLNTGTHPNGHPLRGYAWSEFLGWIKFGLEVGDDPDFTGAFTQWIPDLTPPDVNALLDNAWIPNSSAIGTITWDSFAEEPESAIDLGSSVVEYTLSNAPGYTGCNGNTVAADSAIITQDGITADITFPSIGLIDSSVNNGHCRYELSGVIYNTSGLGYFFGPDADTRATAAGINPLDPYPHIVNITPNSNLHTLAGAYDSGVSTLTFTGSAIADGLDPVESDLAALDVAGNPIVNIPFALDGSAGSLATNVRNVYLNYNFDAQNYLFDSVEPVNNLIFSYPAPLAIGSSRVTYSASDNYLAQNITFPRDGALDISAYNLGVSSYSSGVYELELYGLAPTTGASNALILESIDLNLNVSGETTLPSVSPTMPAVALNTTTNIDNAGSSLYSYIFNPALEVTSASLDTNFIALGAEVTADYDYSNLSANIGLDDYTFDFVFDFNDTSAGIGEEVLEIRDISIGSGTSGRTDPTSSYTRYVVLNEQAPISSTLQSNEFHDNASHYHSPLYSFAFNGSTAANLNGSGEYNVDGAYYGDTDPVTIGRGASINSPLGTSGSSSLSITMEPNQYIGVPMDAQVNFGIDQYIAYNAGDPILTQFTIYPAVNNIDGISLQSSGLGTSGIVSGNNVFENVAGRDLESITTTSSAELQKEIRRNVAQLTRNMDLTNCLASTTTLTTLPVAASDCVVIDSVNDTIIAVYDGAGSGGTLNLGNGSLVTVPADTRYTLIVLNGGNINIEENINYGDNRSSFGMIALSDDTGLGGHVFVDPDPTNIVGLLYAEGSLLSSPDAGVNLYYGAGANTTDLTNQLYWQGSIASKNTIGGSPSSTLPSGVDCSPWPDTQSCAQAHDLDFLRRFITVNESGDEFSPAGYLFSGGGSCSGTYPTINCNYGGIGLATTITIASNLIDVPASLSIDSFFVERDGRRAPLGFSNLGGFTSSQEIR